MQVEGAKQMRDVVQPLVEDRPVARAGDVGCGGGRLEAAHERGEVGGSLDAPTSG